MLFPDDEGVYVVLIAMIDESQTGEKVPVIAVGGGVGTGKQWAKLYQIALKREVGLAVNYLRLT